MILRRRSNRNKKIALFLGVVVIASGIIYSGIFGSLIALVSAPFLYSIGFVQTGAEKVGALFESEEQLREENKILQERIDVLERELVIGDSEEFSTEEDLVRGKVLIRPSGNVYGSLLVKKESGGEVGVGDVVLAPDGVFLGLVDEVSFSGIRVKLSSHPGFSQDLAVQRSGTPITAVGVGGGNMKAELPQGADVERFDIVVDLASGRVVAEVGEVIADEASAFTIVHMRSPANIFEITEVLFAPRLE